MVQPDISTDLAFAPTVLRGLAALGPIELRDRDMTLELGLSLWLRRCHLSVADAVEAMGMVREALVEAAGIDHQTEPVPLVGRAAKDDLVNLAGYISHLIPRAVWAAKCDLGALLESTIEKMQHLEADHTLPFRVAG
jgi:hypothetical protein